MKRAGCLMEQIAEMNNLALAFYKASVGKHNYFEVEQFRSNLFDNLAVMREQILSNTIEVGNYHFFTIYDPKERLICASDFCERVLHHAIMNICHPFFEKNLIDDSYATRIEKGIYKALEKAKRNMARFQYVAKLDVRKYFDSIPHDILLQKLKRMYKDKNLLTLFERIIDSYQSPLSSLECPRGVPIGNLASQYFANFFLSETDHYIKEQLEVPFYVRYMDDMLLMNNDRTLLDNQIVCIKEHLKQVGLNIKPVVRVKSERGISFLGYKLFPHKILLNKTSKIRFKNKYKEYETNLSLGLWNEKEYQSHIIPLLAFVQFAYTKKLRKEILEGSNRVLRGGSWNNNASNCRVANRNNNSPSNRNNNNGFRLAIAQHALSDDRLMNREFSCISFKGNQKRAIVYCPLSSIGSYTDVCVEDSGHFTMVLP